MAIAPCDRVGRGVKRTSGVPPAATVSVRMEGDHHMASDMTLAVGDGSRRTTHAELATRDPAMRALEHAVEGLCEQLEDANQRADRAEERADRAEQRADLLQVKFEAGALTERIARDEAAGLRAELEARHTWGLRRRLRWALGRKR